MPRKDERNEVGSPGHFLAEVFQTWFPLIPGLVSSSQGSLETCQTLLLPLLRPGGAVNPGQTHFMEANVREGRAWTTTIAAAGNINPANVKGQCWTLRRALPLFLSHRPGGMLGNSVGSIWGWEAAGFWELEKHLSTDSDSENKQMNMWIALSLPVFQTRKSE